MDKQEALRGSRLLASLGDKSLASLVSVVKERRYGPGDLIIQAGTEGIAAMHVVLEGSVSVERDGAQLATLGPGAHIGEMSMLSPDPLPRSADVVSVGETTTLQITRWDLMPFLKEDPEVALAVIGELAKRLADANERLAQSS